MDDVQDDVRVSGEEKLTGENTCLGVWPGLCGALWWLRGTGCTHSSFNSKCPGLRDKTGWELEKVMLLYFMPRVCVYPGVWPKCMRALQGTGSVGTVSKV